MRPLHRLNQRQLVDSDLPSSPTSSIVDLGTLISKGEYEDVFSTDHDTTMMPELVSPQKSLCQPMSRTEIRRRLEEHQASTTARPEFPQSSTPLDLVSSNPSYEIQPMPQYREILYSSLSSSPMSRTPALSGSTSSESRSSPFIPQGSNAPSPWVPQHSTFSSLDQAFANLGTTQQQTTSSAPRFDWQSLRPAIPLPHSDTHSFPNFDPFYSPSLITPTVPNPSNPSTTGIDLSAFTQLKPHFPDEALYRQGIPLPPWSTTTSETATSRPLTRSQTLPHQAHSAFPLNPLFNSRNSGPSRDLSVSSWVAQQRSINPFQVLEASEIPSRYTFPPNPPTSSLPPQYDPSFHQFGTQQHNSGLGMSLPALPQHHSSQSTYSHSHSSNPFPPPGLPFPQACPQHSHLTSHPHLTSSSSSVHLSQRRNEFFSTSSQPPSSTSGMMTRSQSHQQPQPPASFRTSPNITLERILNPPYQPQTSSQPDPDPYPYPRSDKEWSSILFPSNSLFMPPPPKELGPIGPPPPKREEQRERGYGRMEDMFGKGAVLWPDRRQGRDGSGKE